MTWWPIPLVLIVAAAIVAALLTWWPIPLVLIVAAAIVAALLTYREREWIPPSDD